MAAGAAPPAQIDEVEAPEHRRRVEIGAYRREPGKLEVLEVVAGADH
ncbi:MAG: hypothetical protein IT293_12920 [Deltaproteobacteria bacterium]|nr:hypothetical protein [Deltaproteobacteria bacterium]